MIKGSPNGVTRNTDGSEIYVADEIEWRVYKRNTKTNELTLI